MDGRRTVGLLKGYYGEKRLEEGDAPGCPGAEGVRLAQVVLGGGPSDLGVRELGEPRERAL